MPAAAPAVARHVARRSLVPHEHGAWFQLALPALTAMALGGATASTLLFACAALAAFIAHEPLLVVAGLRGARRRERERARAARWLAALGGLAAIAGAAGLALAAADARRAALVPLALAAGQGVVIALRHERTTAGETLAAWTLASVGLPIALSAGVAWTAALTALAVWVVVFLVATLGVRYVIARAKGGAARALAAGAAVVALAAVLVAVAAVASGRAPTVTPVALLPVSLLAVALALFPPPPKHLRRVGWGLAAASVATFMILVGGLR